MSRKIKKPEALSSAVKKVVENCPFDEDYANSDERDKMDAAVEELRSAYKEYCDRIERAVIELLRDYQDEYEQFWLKSVDDDAAALDPLRKKYRSLEDKIHGFILRGQKDIFSYTKKGFAGILSSYGDRDNLMHYMDIRVNSALDKMERYISEYLKKCDQDIRTKYLNKKKAPHEVLKKKRSEMYSLKAKYNRRLIKNHDVNVRCAYQDELIALAQEVIGI